jgi:hypothetical protein
MSSENSNYFSIIWIKNEYGTWTDGWDLHIMADHTSLHNSWPKRTCTSCLIWKGEIQLGLWVCDKRSHAKFVWTHLFSLCIDFVSREKTWPFRASQQPGHCMPLWQICFGANMSATLGRLNEKPPCQNHSRPPRSPPLSCLPCCRFAQSQEFTLFIFFFFSRGTLKS